MNEQPTPFSSSFINYYILSLINTCNIIIRLIILIIIIYVVNITVVFLLSLIHNYIIIIVLLVLSSMFLFFSRMMYTKFLPQFDDCSKRFRRQLHLFSSGKINFISDKSISLEKILK